MTKTINTREVALEVLLEICEKGALSHLVITQALKKYQYLEKQERAFLTRLVEGTLERKITLDYIINQYSKKVSVQKMKPVIRTLLRMGVYQILYMDSVPDSAACNETVKLAVRKGFSNLKGFVNGILRTVSREKEHLAFPKKEENLFEYESVLYSMPIWIIEQWIDQYGVQMTEKMLESALLPKQTTVRLNTSKADRKEILKILSKETVTLEPISWYPDAMILSGYDSLEELTSFRQGFFQVQDISSMMVAEACGIRGEEKILDVCAAPGGKSLHAADKLNGTGHVEARDITDYKVALIEENICRCGLKNLSVKKWDAKILDKTMELTQDIVIADVPCSGLGVVGKKNDLKYNVTLEGQKELVQLQRKILETVSSYVKVGGVLLYSTCTTNKEENEENVKWFLENNPSFELEDLTAYLPEKISDAAEESLHLKEQLCTGMVQFLQGVFPSDGFFLARLKKKDDRKAE